MITFDQPLGGGLHSLNDSECFPI